MYTDIIKILKFNTKKGEMIMGRFLAFGVASTIIVYSKKSHSINDKKEEIIEELKEHLDISCYDCKEEDNKLIFKIKTKCFDDNIHDLLKKLNDLMNFQAFLDCDTDYGFDYEDVDIMSNKFNKKDAPLVLKQYTNKDYNHDIGDYYCEWNGTPEAYSLNYPQYWLFDCPTLKQNIEVDICYINLWHDWNKIASEDETILLKILNTIWFPYLDNNLAKNCLFYIFG